MRVYHFVNAEYGLQNISKRRLKLATIQDLNDPFELLWLTSKDKLKRAAIHKTKRDLARMAGLLCFSPDWSNPVMWSHYADRHRGLCLGFDVPDVLLLKMDYVDGRQELTEDTEREIRDRSIRTKFHHWHYEQERRLFEDIRELTPQSGLYFKPFSDSLSLREVIIGPRSKVTRKMLAEALGELSEQVLIITARLAFQAFTVTTQKNRRRWK